MPSARSMMTAGYGWLVVLTLSAGPALAQNESQAPQGPHVAPELKFSSFFSQPVGPLGLQIAGALRAADGQRVRLVGYMVAQEEPAPGRFMLTPRPVRMSEHADGEADDLPPTTVTVLLDERQRDRVVPHQPGLIALTGRLQVGRNEDSSGRVSWVRLHLEPNAVSEGRSGESSLTNTHQHAHTRQ